MPVLGHTEACHCYSCRPQTIHTEGKTVREVLHELNTRLKALGLDPSSQEYGWDDMSRLESFARDYSRDSDDGTHKSTPWPERARWICVYPVTGSSEGYYIHIDAIYQPTSLLLESFDKAKEQDPRVYQPRESTLDRRYLLGLAKVWEWDIAWKIARATADLLGV